MTGDEFLKKGLPAQTKRMDNNKLNNNDMSNTLNYKDLAYQQMQGLSYDELLELQAETGLSIQQLEFMYYNL